MKVAVVSGAVSEGYFFPIWQRYYGALFGAENLFVVTYLGGSAFDAPELGGVTRLPHGFDDDKSAGVFADRVATLLRTYDAVIRVDVDEFLVVDPRVAVSLRDFLEKSNDPYYTARGFDVAQMPGEAPLVAGPLLAQRRVAYPNSALNKTVITRTPLRWSPGFHWATVPPRFSGLFMLHLKRIDIDWQVNWFRTMTENIAAQADGSADLLDYYEPDRRKIEAYHEAVSHRPVLSGIDSWYRDAHQQQFMASIQHEPASGFHWGSFDHELVLCEIPTAFKQLL